jgi:FMN-dependent NADH-azoreductase
MAEYLLQIDSSVRDGDSVSRALTERTAQRWLESHPDGRIEHRDLARRPLPLFDAAAHQARSTPVENHTAEQAAQWHLSRTLTDEVKEADTVVLGLPLYNWAPPAAVKTWIDHLFAPGLSRDPATGAGLLGAPRFIVVVTRGGGYRPGAPRHGWDHATPWVEHVLDALGVSPELLVVEMTLSTQNPALAEFKPVFERELAEAEAAVDKLWAEDAVQAH